MATLRAITAVSHSIQLNASDPVLEDDLEIWQIEDLSKVTHVTELTAVVVKTELLFHRIALAPYRHETVLTKNVSGNPAHAEFQAIGSSPIAARAGEALHLIRSATNASPAWIRMLRIPQLHVRALWLSVDGQEQVVVFDQPDDLEHLHPMKRQSSATFLEALRPYGGSPVFEQKTI